MKHIIFAIVVLHLFITLGNSQDCTDYHQFQCTYTDYTFFYSQQSKSLLLSRGQSREINMVAYAGEEYYVSVCAHNKFGNIQFKILEDNNDRTVVYDNTKDSYSSSITFENERTRKLIIEVTVPPGKENDKERRCVGVLVEFKKKE